MDEILRELAKQGPLGILNVLQAIAIVKLYSDLKTATAKQAESAERSIQILMTSKEESKGVQGLLRSLLTGSERPPRTQRRESD